MSDGWLDIARELRAIAQTGLTFTQDSFDRQRYERVRELSAALTAEAAAAPNSGAARLTLSELFSAEVGYATPKVDVRGAVIDDGQLLLVREISDGRWSLPGGWADVNQTARECVVREVLEESGYAVRAVKLAAVHDYRRRHPNRHLDSIYKLFFICEPLGGTARPSNETSEVRFFPHRELPELSLGRTTPEQIELMFLHAAHPSLPTEFD